MKFIIEHEKDIIIDAKKYMEFPDLFNSIDEPRFGIHETGASSRAISNWIKEGLLDNAGKEGKWYKFTFVQLTWIKMIIKLREYNCSIKMIKDLKELLYEEIVIDIDSKEYKDQIERIILDLVKSQGHPEEVVKQLLQSEDIKEAMSKFKIRLLKLYIMDAIILKSHFAFNFNSKGDFVPYKESFINVSQKFDKFQEFMHSSYISISLTEILSDFIIDTPLETVNKTLHIITDAEAKIIETVRTKDIKSITIKKNKNDKIDLMSIQSEPKLTKADRLTKLIVKNGYQEITIRVVDGEVVYCKNDRLEKFKNSGTGLAGPKIR